MKKTILSLAIFLTNFAFAQTSEVENVKWSPLTINPTAVSRKTNGLNVGILDSYENRKINGINFQLNPITLLYLLIPTALEVPEKGSETVSINGLHLSTGGMLDGGTLNGIGISMYHIAQESNGITFNGFNNNSGKLNGVHVSWLNNSTENGNGILVAFSNTAEKFNGIQLGLFNEITEGNGLQVGINNSTSNLRGIQIGIINKSKSRKGLQLGFWNKNAKRTLPFINF
ncbi:LA_2272 family surface repeat-containing protein [Chryseobacterium sp. MP_3.2]|uniref:LA_2272 family surface repeat-containing protein n=1 Tax=Chryseobacterium sp. MP_3.2 TaxID=3071712 RepID=UPI002E036B49|nr:hypothetical protein [Chryseobacterium sp. MP_3.2]